MQSYTCTCNDKKKFNQKHLILLFCFSDFIMDARNQYFEQLLKRFDSAGKGGYNKLKTTVETEISAIAKFQVPEVRPITSQRIDYTSLEIYPKNDPFCKGFIPTPVYGDGNCLCRSGSMYVFGNEASHVEIRCRIVAEMVMNKEWFLATNSIRQYAQFVETIESYDDLRCYKSVEDVFERSTVKFTKKSSWGEMWHLIAISNVLGCTLFSIYPDLIGTKRDRHLLHTKFIPRVLKTTANIRIMWTNTSIQDKGSVWWTPNHFVPCVSEITDFSSSRTCMSPRKRKNPTLGDYFKFTTVSSSKTSSKVIIFYFHFVKI